MIGNKLYIKSFTTKDKPKKKVNLKDIFIYAKSKNKPKKPKKGSSYKKS